MTNLDYARMLINDTDTDNEIFTDKEILELVNKNSNVRLEQADLIASGVWQTERHINLAGIKNITISSESLATCDGSTVTYSGTIANIVVIPGTLTITASGTASDNGDGVISGNNATGTVNYETGAITITFTNPPSSGTKILLSYQYSYWSPKVYQYKPDAITITSYLLSHADVDTTTGLITFASNAPSNLLPIYILANFVDWDYFRADCLDLIVSDPERWKVFNTLGATQRPITNMREIRATIEDLRSRVRRF